MEAQRLAGRVLRVQQQPSGTALPPPSPMRAEMTLVLLSRDQPGARMEQEVVLRRRPEEPSLLPLLLLLHPLAVK